jgi:hypothetical protein
MECGEARTTVGKLFSTTSANRTPFGATRHFRVTGWTGSPVKTLRRFTCGVRYGKGTGANYGGIRLTITCHDFNGDRIRYAEEQDSE